MSLSVKELAEKQYNQSLQKIEKKMGKSTTYDYQLTKNGRKLFGRAFIGVFAADQFPKNIKNGQCFIINLDTSSEPGSHWLAICKEKTHNILWAYDSFARNIHKILPSIDKSHNIIKSTEKDVEQKNEETNCGQRSLAFIDVFLKMGPKYAKYI